LSSTTRRAAREQRVRGGRAGGGRARGQALALFAISLSALLAGAALAFDAGAMMLERRDQQNAADSAAIAGARYLRTNTSKSIATAIEVAAANGFANGADSELVTVSIPPTSGPFQGRANHIEVSIASSRPSIFGGVMGVASWPVSVRAVATNGDSYGGNFSILSLHPSLCDAMLVSGSGTLLAYGNIQVNSTCNNGALRRQGGGSITVDVDGGACDVVGTIRDGGGQGVLQCIRNEGAPVLPDPLASLPDPAVPPLPAPMIQEQGSLSVPTGCPGSAAPATLAAPSQCQFTSSYAGTKWRIFPGLYPGGLKLQGGTFYFEPGIYYIAGGGLDLTGTGTTTLSVDSGATTGPAGGVLFYNTGTPNSAVGPVNLNGSSAQINLFPLDMGTRYDGLIIWQDRSININGDDVTINGGSSTMEVRGTVYVPLGDVKVNGGSGTLVMDQIIAHTYVVHGSPGSLIKVLKEEFFRFRLLAAGLVE
jgi:Flp pilus assembly protein TadG